MRRILTPELLDSLPPADPQAVGSRADLRRLNFLMGHARILSCGLRLHLDEPSVVRSRPLRIVELGAGDGTLLLRVARGWSTPAQGAQATLVDRQDLVATETHHAFAALRWSTQCVAADVFAWLERPSPTADVMLANLFLHHFPDRTLAMLLRLVAARTNLFIACEPRRARLALGASRCLGLLGCNAVTRHDAAVSVQAGFVSRELTAMWPSAAPWQTHERAAGLFSHCFVAKRHG